MSGRISKEYRPVVDDAVAAGCQLVHPNGDPHYRLVTPTGRAIKVSTSSRSRTGPHKLRAWLRRNGVDLPR